MMWNCSIMPAIALLRVMEKDVAGVRIKAETIIDNMLDWFCVYKMKANNDKFQYNILFNRNGLLNDEHMRNGSIEVKAESCVKLLGLYFDQQ